MNTKQEVAKEYYYSFDFIRVAAMLGVILYHAAAAYSYLSPYWPVQDGQNIIGDGLRALLVVFIMPFFFFIAGYFILPSLRNNSLLNFIWRKFKRLGGYWIFIVLIILPFFNSKTIEGTGSYINYWLNSLLQFRNIQIGPLLHGVYNNMHFWFISLLLFVYILFGVIYKFPGIFRNNQPINAIYRKMALSNLLIFGLLVFTVDFLFILVFPDSNWVVVPNVIQFNINQLPVMILYFGFGMVARYKEWFSRDDLPFKLHQWLFLALLFTAGYFLIGQEFFKNIAVSNTLSPLYLLCVSLIRSFLLLSYLMSALSLAKKYFSGKNRVLHELADVSYEIYLVHMIIVVAFQMAFAGFAFIPTPVKIFAVFLLSTITSYLLGKFTIHKYPRASAVAMTILFLLMPLIFNG
jgi:peptidoglycan/LPS O-acetylase OafA/YrhL